MYNLKKNIVCFETIDSTQKEVWRQFEEDNIKDSLVIITKKQTDGIGTHGRKWINESKDNILFSIGINFEKKQNLKVTIENLDGVTTEIAKILIDTFYELYKINLIKIKMPNDLILNDKKIGGILTETKLQGNVLKKLVLGIGINTNQKNFIDENIKNIATSINKELNMEINNRLVIENFIEKFEKNLNRRIGI